MNMNSSFYRKIKLIGKGEFGNVYQAIDIINNQEVAIKEIDISLYNDNQKMLLLREIDIMKKLSNDYIMTFYKSFLENNIVYLILEYIPGEDLKKFIEKKKRNKQIIDQNTILIILKGIVNGLLYLHSNKIIHRDISPDNIMIYDGLNGLNIKITDFGISKFYQMNNYNNDNCNTHTIIGKPDYISPEMYNAHLNGNKRAAYDFKTDIYSLGVTMYELMTYELPFRYDIYNHKRKGVLPIKSSMASLYNQELINIIMRMLEEDPHKRPSINEIYNELNQLSSFNYNNNSQLNNYNNNLDNDYLIKLTSFFSSIYSLYNIDKIQKYFECPRTLETANKFKKKYNENGSTSITISFIEVIANLNSSAKSKLEIINVFIQNISKKILIFTDYDKITPKVVLSNLFEYLFCNINKIFISYNNETELKIPEEFRGNPIIKEKVKEFQNYYTNVIADTFCFLLFTKRFCPNCGNVLEEIMDIEYDLDFAQKGNLALLLEEFQSQKNYSNLGKKPKICKQCYTMPLNLIEIKQIFSFPRVMIMHFESEVKIEEKIEFNDMINKTKKIYKVKSVIYKDGQDKYNVSAEKENIGNWANYYINRKEEFLSPEDILSKRTICTAFYEMIE